MRSRIWLEVRAALRLTFPLAAAQVAQAANGFVDTVMMGWLGQDVLAAGGIAATTFMTLLITATGVVTGISPLVAEAHGSGRTGRIQRLSEQGFWLAALLSLPAMLLLAQMRTVMPYLGQSSALASQAQPYLDILLWGFFPALAFAMLKDVVSSLSQPQPVMVIVIAGTGFNAIANYALGFGHWGLPGLGLVGLAWASAVSFWLMLMALMLYARYQRRLKAYCLLQRWRWGNLAMLRELIWLGVPIGISFALETSLFAAVTYLMGALGQDVLAAHQIVFQTIAVIFMVPLGLSYATTIRVGQWNGQQDPAGVRRAAYVSMVLGGGFMVVAALLLLLFPRAAIALFLDVDHPDNAAVVSLAVSMFAIAALSQILDGVQTAAAGALRGLKDTRVPMVLSFLAFWGVGLASGYILGFGLGLGGVGLWLGQAIGVGTAAILFIWRFCRLLGTSLDSL